jgi:hypothetical protein
MRFRPTVRRALASLLVVALASLPMLTPRALAQASTSSTTLSAALTATAKTFTVASATGFAAGSFAFVDAELMAITAVSSTLITVQRGVNGTAAVGHASGAVIYAGLPTYFSAFDPSGPCTAVNETALPRIVPKSGSVYDCKDSEWVLYARGGIREYSMGRTDGGTTYTSSGAITVKPGLVLLGSGGALAMTLAAPTTQQNGMTMIILASTAQAHTITNTAGFNAGTTARDVCTLGGAIGDGLTIVASAGVWYVISKTNCTLA